MTPKEILEIDAKRNHPPGTTAGHLMADINDDLRKGGSVVQEGSVLMVYRAIEPGVVEFHTFNAGTPIELVTALQKLEAVMVKAGAKKSITRYTNPKITELFQRFNPKNATVTEKNGIFTAEVRL